MTWHIVSSQDGSGTLDAWKEYLCVRPNPEGEGWEIAICGHEVLGEPPSAWFSDDGEPLPEFRDENGDLKLPEEWEGKAVSHFDGEYIVGDLMPVTDDALVTLERYDTDGIRDTLKDLEWDGENSDVAILAILAQGAA